MKHLSMNPRAVCFCGPVRDRGWSAQHPSGWRVNRYSEGFRSVLHAKVVGEHRSEIAADRDELYQRRRVQIEPHGSCSRIDARLADASIP